MGLEGHSKSSLWSTVAEFPQLTIGEVARRSGVAASTIRYYELIGLLPKPERESGQRRYRDEVLGKLSFIGVAQEAGLTLREIDELVSEIGRGPEMAEPMRALSSRKLPEVRALIEHAEQMRGWLEAASDCTCATPDECALFPEPGQGPLDAEPALSLVLVHADGCRRRGRAQE
jgi:MerR family redox-sensitive transcriptional activator SoxR